MILRGNFFSKTLEMETSISMVAPDNFTVHPYKIVYLLHGLCGRSGDWIDYTRLPSYAKDYHTIFIMPEVARSFYTDMAFGLCYFSYITEELPLMCNSLFNLSSKREDAAIFGASMGGYGALKAALTNPQSYGFCAAFSSPCLMLKEHLEYSEGAKKFEELFGERLFKDFQAAFGQNIEWNPKHDVVELAKNRKPNTPSPELYLACGSADMLYSDNKRFHEIVSQQGFESTFEEWEGNHTWEFFDEALKRALSRFCSDKR